jgi:predicted nucleic acid-binding protein
MFVVDASVVASWCFPDEEHPAAQQAFARIAAESASTPALFWFELRNVLLTGERRKRIAATETARFLGLVRDLPIIVDQEPDEAVVLNLARKHKLSVYDAAYLELAQRKALHLATLDKALIEAAREESIVLVGGK